MPVPSAFNDLTMESTLRDHVGWVWYQTIYYLHYSNLPKCVKHKQKCYFRTSSTIYFESVNYEAHVVSIIY